MTRNKFWERGRGPTLCLITARHHQSFREQFSVKLSETKYLAGVTKKHLTVLFLKKNFLTIYYYLVCLFSCLTPCLLVRITHDFVVTLPWVFVAGLVFIKLSVSCVPGHPGMSAWSLIIPAPSPHHQSITRASDWPASLESGLLLAGSAPAVSV